MGTGSCGGGGGAAKNVAPLSGAHTSPDALAFHVASGPSSSPASDLALQDLDGHLDRMADAATNSGTTLSQLTDANTRLASVTSTQYQAIKKLLTEIKNSNSSSPNPRSSRSGAGATNDQQTIQLLQSVVKNRWIVGGLCSSHGWGVSYQHTSTTCKNKLAGHIDTATRSTPADPGKTKNQGWYAFT